MYELHSWIGDQHAVSAGCDNVYSLRSWAVQPGVDDGLCSVQCGSVSGECGADELCGVFRWVGDEHSEQHERDDMHCLCGWSVQQCVDQCVCDLQCRIDDEYVE